MLQNNTWFDIPFRLPFNLLYMPGTMAHLVVESSTKISTRLSVFLNETTVTTSKTITGKENPEAREKFEIPILLS